MTKYARNNKEIARALSLPIKKAMLAEIGTWFQRQDFPKKVRKGWAVEELLKWFEQVTPEFAAKKARAAIFDPEKNIKPSDLKIARDIGIPNAEHGPRTAETESELPEFIDGLTRTAAVINAFFKIPCTRQQIKEWQKKSPPFPAPTSAGRYNRADCFAWVEKWIAKHDTTGRGTMELFAQLEPERVRNELEEIAHQRRMREVELGAYIKKDIMGRIALGVGKQISGEITKVERVLPADLEADLKEIGVSDEMRLRIMERFRVRCQRFNEGLQQRIPARLKELVVEEGQGSEVRDQRSEG